MPLDATATEAAADAEASTTNNRQVVHVSLIFKGVTYDPSDLYDALNAQWGTVTTEKDTLTRNAGIFLIEA